MIPKVVEADETYVGGKEKGFELSEAATLRHASLIDIDLLVDVTGVTTPWFPASLAADLEQLLGKRVQIVIHRSLSPLIREAVLSEAIPL